MWFSVKNKIIISIFILIASIFIAQVVYAVPAAPTPTCEIIATVLNIEKVGVVIHKDFVESPSKVFKCYKVKLDILNITTYKQEGVGSCDNSYVERVEQSGAILTLTEYEKNPIEEGQKIRAKIQFGSDEGFSSYFLSDIQILEDAATPQDKKEVELSYWYYTIPTIIILLAVIFCVLFKKIKK